jgi:hypothetical protein
MTIFQLIGKIWEVAGMRVMIESQSGLLDPRIDVRVAHVSAADGQSGFYREITEQDQIGDYRAVILSSVGVREQ